MMIKDEIRSREALRCQALMRGDMAALSNLLGMELTHIHASGSIDDRDTYLRDVETKYVFHDVRRGDLRITVHGDVAVVTGPMQQTVSRQSENERHVVELVTTQIWAKEAGGWKQTVCHSTFMK